MSPTVVSNSTPIIALAKIARIEILQELYGSITIPEAVRDEVADSGRNRAGSEWRIDLFTFDQSRFTCPIFHD